MPNHGRPGLRERWWMWLRDATWRLSAWAERRETGYRARRALPRGTSVVLPEGRCCCIAGEPAHQGVWFVDRYEVDADDYKLVRVLEAEFSAFSLGEATFACRKAMEVVPAGNP